MQKEKSIINFYNHLINLKKLKRKGWLLAGIKKNDCESVAEHTFSMTMTAMFFLKDFPELNELKVLKMCLIHDLAESIVGDITPYDNTSINEKFESELRALNCVLSDSKNCQEWIDIWKEFESYETQESLFVKDIDKLDMLLQALRYQKDNNTNISSFVTSTLDSIKDEWILKTTKQILNFTHTPNFYNLLLLFP